MKDSSSTQRGLGGCLVRLVVGVFVVAGAISAVVAWQYEAFVTGDVVTGQGPIDVEIEPGWSSYRAVAELRRAGSVVESPFWSVHLRWAAVDCLQAGVHTIPGTATPSQLLRALCETSYAPGIRLTLIEGQNLFELSDEIARVGFADRDEVLALAQSAEFAASVGVAAPTLEGYLAPNTYEFYEDADGEEVLRRLADAGTELRERLFADDTDVSAEFSRHEILTMASIVERESQVADERPLIARVLLNRLAAGMPLQCDPTCVYAPDLYQQEPSPATCRDPESTHSTYVLPALPPTPIANPRAESIAAVLRPASDTSLLYFVARMDGTGRHAFSATYEEHRRNVRQYLGGR